MIIARVLWDLRVKEGWPTIFGVVIIIRTGQLSLRMIACAWSYQRDRRIGLGMVRDQGIFVSVLWRHLCDVGILPGYRDTDDVTRAGPAQSRLLSLDELGVRRLSDPAGWVVLDLSSSHRAVPELRIYKTAFRRVLHSCLVGALSLGWKLDDRLFIVSVLLVQLIRCLLTYCEAIWAIEVRSLSFVLGASGRRSDHMLTGLSLACCLTRCLLRISEQTASHLPPHVLSGAVISCMPPWVLLDSVDSLLSLRWVSYTVLLCSWWWAIYLLLGCVQRWMSVWDHLVVWLL